MSKNIQIGCYLIFCTLFQVEVHKRREALLDLMQDMYLNSNTTLLKFSYLHLNIDSST